MAIIDLIKYCSLCGQPITRHIPVGDNRERHVCSKCGEIHYQNPKVITGCIPVCGKEILLCRRAIEPRKGFWTVPAGFMENGETVAEGAARETVEEACAPLVNMRLFGVYSLPRISQVYIMYIGDLADPEGFGVGEESIEVGLFSEADIPWDGLAFRIIDEALRRFFQERAEGKMTVANVDIN